MSAPVDVVTPPPGSHPPAPSLPRLTLVVTAVAVGLAAVWDVRVAVGENFHIDLWVYSSGAALGLQGQSPYDTDRIRESVNERWWYDPQMQNNSGFFLAPQGLLVFAPFAVLPWVAAKLAWSGLMIAATAAGALGLRRLSDRPRLAVWFPAAAVGLVLLNPMSQFSMLLGQTALFVFTCVVFGQAAFTRGRVRVGCLLWALTFLKPHVAFVLLPLAWWLHGWRRAAEVAGWAAALNALAGLVFFGHPLFVLDYLRLVQQGYKAVDFNRVELNAEITSWNRLVVECGGPAIELGAAGMAAGYAVFGLLVAARVRAGGAWSAPSPAWAFALAGCAAVTCCQVQLYDLPWLLLGLPYLGELLTSGRRRDKGVAGFLLCVLLLTLKPIGNLSPLISALMPFRCLGVMLLTATVLLNGPVRPARVPSTPEPLDSGRGNRGRRPESTTAPAIAP